MVKGQSTVLMSTSRLYWSKWLLIGLLLCCSSRSWSEPSTLLACEDGTWPPYSYVQADQIKGASIEFLQALTSQVGLQLDFRLMPWKRCLAQVLAYPHTKMEVFINGSSNDERMQSYLRTLPIFKTRRGYVFHKKHLNKLDRIESVKDLNDFRICGVLGYNYQHEIDHGLTAGINTSATDVQQAINRVQTDKCDVFLASFEVIEGGLHIGVLRANDQILVRPTPGIETIDVHYWITRSSPRSQWLLEQFNRAIHDMQVSGESDRIFKRYLESGDGID